MRWSHAPAASLQSKMLTEAAMSCAARRNIGQSVREAWRGIADPGPAERLAASLARHPEIKVTF